MAAGVSIVDLSPLKSATLVWRPQRGGAVATIVCKSTYELKAGVAKLHEVQDGPNKRDFHAENNPQLGLYSASDLVPYKPRADVLVVGRAYSKPNELARVVVARVQVGTVDKRIEVHAERWLQRDGRVVDDKFFSKMPIGYERAAGGPGTMNPAGMSLSSKPDSRGRLKLPNVQRPGEAITKGSELTPIGLGPLPASWPARALLAGGRGVEWLESDPLSQTIPSDFNWAFFNAGPADQQTDEIRPDELLRLEGLHPAEHALETRLCGVQPWVYVERRGEAQRLPFRGDTLWIDTNRLMLTVTWRAQMNLEDASEPVRVLVGMAEGDRKPSWDEVWADAETKRRLAEKREEARRRSDTPVPSQPERSSQPSSQSRGSQPPESIEPAARAARSLRLRQESSPRLTSPVPVRAEDHTPVWMPAPSSARAPIPVVSTPGALAQADTAHRGGTYFGEPVSVRHGGPPSTTLPMAPPQMPISSSNPPVSSSPAPSAPVSNGEPVVVELSDVDRRKLHDLCNALGGDPVEVLLHALREAHQSRFGG
jgi:hypothetical protein